MSGERHFLHIRPRIYPVANVVIDEHGSEAALYAAIMADEFLENGDVVAARMWKLILAKIDELKEMVPQMKTVH